MSAYSRRGLPFLAGGVPDLGLDTLVLDDQGAGLELDADCGLGVQAELVTREPRQYLRLTDRRVPYQHHLEHVVYLLVRVARHFLHTESASSGIGGKARASAVDIKGRHV